MSALIPQSGGVFMFTLTPLASNENGELAPAMRELAPVRCPDTRKFDTVDQALRAGRMMTHNAFRMYARTSMTCPAILVQVELCTSDSFELVRQEVVLRGSLVCPSCGEVERIEPANAGKPTACVFGYDRQLRSLVRLHVEAVISVKCVHCGEAGSAREFSTGVDLLGWYAGKVEGKEFGARYISLRETRGEQGAVSRYLDVGK